MKRLIILFSVLISIPLFAERVPRRIGDDCGFGSVCLYRGRDGTDRLISLQTHEAPPFSREHCNQVKPLPDSRIGSIAADESAVEVILLSKEGSVWTTREGSRIGNLPLRTYDFVYLDC